MFPSTLPLPRLIAASQVPQLHWGSIEVLLAREDVDAPGNFTLTSSDRQHRLQWQESASRYEQLCNEINHFAWCIGQNRIDSPIHSLDQAITTLAAMDNVRQQIGVTFNEEQQP